MCDINPRLPACDDSFDPKRALERIIISDNDFDQQGYSFSLKTFFYWIKDDKGISITLEAIQSGTGLSYDPIVLPKYSYTCRIRSKNWKEISFNVTLK